MVRHEREQRLGALMPELLGPFHPAVDLLDGRLDVAGSNRQAQLAVLGVFHPRALVLKIAQRLGDNGGGRCLVAFARRAKFFRARRDRRNELVDRLERAGGLSRLFGALRSGLQYRKVSGASIPDLLRSALAMRRHERLTRSQMLMAANAPMLAKKAMQEGDPIEGYLPSGSVAGVIDDRPSCAELVSNIVAEAERTLKALGVEPGLVRPD